MHNFSNSNNYDYRNNSFAESLPQPQTARYVNPSYLTQNHFNQNMNHQSSYIPQPSHYMPLSYSFYSSESTTPSPSVYNLNSRHIPLSTRFNAMNTQYSTSFNNPYNSEPVPNKNKNNKNLNKSKQQKNKNHKNTIQNKEFSDFSQMVKSIAKKLIMDFIDSKIDEWLNELEEKVKGYLINSLGLNQINQANIKPQQNIPSVKTNNLNNFKQCMSECVDFPEPVEQKQVDEKNNYQNANNKANEIKAYNTEPFDQPCPIEEFANKIVTDTSQNLPTCKDNVQIMEDKMNQYRQNYNFGFAVPQNTNIPTSLSELELRFNSLPRNPPIDIRTNTTVQNVVIDNDKNSEHKINNPDTQNTTNLKNEKNLTNKIEKDITNEQSNNLSNLLNMFGKKYNDNVDLKNFIYGEILNNISSQLNDTKIEQTINNLSSFISQNNTNKNDDSTSIETLDSETDAYCIEEYEYVD